MNIATQEESAAQSTERSDNAPEGWLLARFGDVVSPSKAKVEPQQWPKAKYLSLEHVESGSLRIIGHGHAEDVRSTKSVFRSGDVLYGKLRPYLNKVCVPAFDGICSTDFLVFPQRPEVESPYLSWFLSQPNVVEFANHHSTGVQLPRVNFEALGELEFPLPPLAEQKRIVAKVEELLARVNSARERMARVPAILKRFRQGVLAAACSGRLTADWREAHPAREPLTDSVERMKTERRQGWKRGRYRDPLPCSSPGLPEVPATWGWVSFDTFVVDSFYGPRFSREEYSASGVPTIRTTDFEADGSIVPKAPPGICLTADQMEELTLVDGDLLVTRSGTVGKCALYEAKLGPAIPSAYLIRFRLTRQSVPPKYMLLYFLSPAGQALLLGGSTSVTQVNVNAKTISMFPVPLPPSEEVTEIVRRVEALFRLADAIEERVVAATARAEKLTQAILAKAFRGELVPTEAELARREGRDYEPASALLARIRAEHAAGPSPSTRRHKPNPLPSA